MRGLLKYERDRGRMRIFFILAAGIILTGNAFLEARGRGPLTELVTALISRFYRSCRQERRGPWQFWINPKAHHNSIKHANLSLFRTEPASAPDHLA